MSITPLVTLTGCLALSKIEVIMLYSVINVLSQRRSLRCSDTMPHFIRLVNTFSLEFQGLEIIPLSAFLLPLPAVHGKASSPTKKKCAERDNSQAC
jgi:hypothetical protein